MELTWPINVFGSEKAKVLQPTVVQRLHLHRWHSKTVTLSQKYQLATGGDMSKVWGHVGTATMVAAKFCFVGWLTHVLFVVILCDWLLLIEERFQQQVVQKGWHQPLPISWKHWWRMLSSQILQRAALPKIYGNVSRFLGLWVSTLDVSWGSSLLSQASTSENLKIRRSLGQPTKDVLLSLHDHDWNPAAVFFWCTVVHAIVWPEMHKRYVTMYVDYVYTCCLDMSWFLSGNIGSNCTLQKSHFDRQGSTEAECYNELKCNDYCCVNDKLRLKDWYERLWKCRNQMVVEWYFWTKSCTQRIKIPINCSVSTCFDHPNWYRPLFIKPCCARPWHLQKNMVLQQILNLLNQEGAAQILGSTDEECCEAANWTTCCEGLRKGIPILLSQLTFSAWKISGCGWYKYVTCNNDMFETWATLHPNGFHSQYGQTCHSVYTHMNMCIILYTYL